MRGEPLNWRIHMIKNEKTKLYVNRIVAFLLGGLLMFAVMSFTVVKNVKTQNAEITSALDTSRYEAGRLLEDAKAQLASGDYSEAKQSLTTLFENQPGSAEAAEGKKLMPTIETAEVKADEQWEAALPDIREQWSKNMKADLREKADAERAKLESEMDTRIAQAWDKEKEQIREEWEQQR